MLINLNRFLFHQTLCLLNLPTKKAFKEGVKCGTSLTTYPQSIDFSKSGWYNENCFLQYREH